jgi:L-aminopeptidase/D-esterase-like protein
VSVVDFSPLGVAVGHATDVEGATGLTVVRHVAGAFRGGSCIVGRATATRELHLASPSHVTDRIDALLLTGGSAYGLDAAAGVMKWMEERRRGFPMAQGVVPLVPAAAVFDLAPLGRFDARPTSQMAYDACETARPVLIQEGSVGAGTGATVGKATGLERAMKGGFGCWLEQVDHIAVGAVAVVNAVGDVRDGRGQILAGARTPDGGFLDCARFLARSTPPNRVPAADLAGRNTSLAVVMTNASLSRLEVQQLAQSASAAMYRRITPAGTTFDGDIVFALCQHEGPSTHLVQIEALAVEVLEMAIERAVRLAVGRDGLPGLAG